MTKFHDYHTLYDVLKHNLGGGLDLERSYSFLESEQGRANDDIRQIVAERAYYRAGAEEVNMPSEEVNHILSNVQNILDVPGEPFGADGFECFKLRFEDPNPLRARSSERDEILQVSGAIVFKESHDTMAKHGRQLVDVAGEKAPMWALAVHYQLAEPGREGVLKESKWMEDTGVGSGWIYTLPLWEDFTPRQSIDYVEKFYKDKEVDIAGYSPYTLGGSLAHIALSCIAKRSVVF